MSESRNYRWLGVNRYLGFALTAWGIIVLCGGIYLYAGFGRVVIRDPAFYVGGLLLTLSSGMALGLTRLSRRYQTEAITDGLTGLFNHRYFLFLLKKWVKRVREGREPLALLIIDIDDFKTCNDVLGHLQGDLVLQTVARFLKEQVRAEDVVARYGGDEFAVIMPGHNMETAEVIARRIARAAWEYPFPGREVMPGGIISLSIGAAMAPPDGMNAQELIRAADNRMYVDKNDLDPGEEFELRETLAAVELVEKLVWQKDAYIPGHNLRVAHYAIEIAKQLDIPGREVFLAGVLHDLGKIEISRELLWNPRPLTPEEGDLIRHHVEASAIIARALGMSEEIIEAVYHHHERFDGSGYPDRLSGADIPLTSRIIAVADSYDAMTTNRAYRVPFTMETASAEIRDHAGRLYDPDVVTGFFRCLSVSRSVAVAEVREDAEAEKAIH